MTLILACLTKDNVFQVSDRRLTNLRPPHNVVEDERNKAVVLNGRVSFGYTGLANLDNRTRTDDWLADVVASGPNHDMAQVAERIRNRATEVFARWKIQSSFKRHAFQGVGWFRLNGETSLSPGIITIDNAIDHRSGDWLAEPLREFKVTTQFPERFPGGCILNSIGVTVSRNDRSAVVRLVRKCVKHRNATPQTIVQSLTMAVRWLSARYPKIGSGMMVVRISKNSVENIERMSRVRLVSDQDFFYVSKAGLSTRFGPHFVVGRTAITGLESGSLPR